MRISFFVPILLIGCAIGPPTPIDTDVTVTIPPPPTGTTAPPQFSDEGSVMLMLELSDSTSNVQRTMLAGVFDKSNREWSNLAYCMALQFDGFCADTLPAVYDDYVIIDLWTDTLTNPLEFLDVGPAFSLGSYTAPKKDVDGVLFYFDSTLGSDNLPTTPMDLFFSGGVWDEWTGTGVISAPSTPILTEPETNREHVWTAEAPVMFEWDTAGATGDVYLAVLTPALNRLYMLEDDGNFELDLVALGLTDNDSVTLLFGRWSTTDVDFDGNAIDVTVQVQQRLEGEFHDLTGRTELVAEDTCSDASLLAPLLSGNYFGRVDSFSNGHNPGNGGCTGWSAQGQDGILKVELVDQAGIDATYRLLNGDASLYLLEDCANESTCLVGADQALVGDWETINYFNNTGQTQTLWLILDSNQVNYDLFELDVFISRPDVLVDACATALYEYPAPTGLYNGDITAFHNYTDPAGGCSGTTAPGQEGMTKIELLPNETFTAEVTMPGSQPVLYLLFNCSISASCAATSGYPTGDTAMIQYQNTSLANEILYLVADSLVSAGPYTLEIQIQ